MTREERNNAIKVLKNFDLNNSKVNSLLFSAEEITNAFDMAIEALEQQPCEDTISRKEALDALHMCLSTNSYDDDVTGDSYICYEEAEYEIENLPPVTPKESKTGHWIYELEDWNKWTCSECGWSKRTDVHVKLGYSYCPNCGAKMIKPQESEVQDADSD